MLLLLLLLLLLLVVLLVLLVRISYTFIPHLLTSVPYWCGACCVASYSSWKPSWLLSSMWRWLHLLHRVHPPLITRGRRPETVTCLLWSATMERRCLQYHLSAGPGNHFIPSSSSALPLLKQHDSFQSSSVVARANNTHVLCVGGAVVDA